MRIRMAEVSGMCFGVRDALKVADRVVSPEAVTIHGHLVHNEVVLTRLGARGFRMVGEQERDEPPPTPAVLITAHGVSDAERSRLEAAGKTLIDTTCPLVSKAHRAAKEFRDDGDFVVVVGRPGHVEVAGLVGDLTQFAVADRPEAVTEYPSSRIGVVFQTTTSPRLADAMRATIVERNPHAEVRFADTICAPTRAHQRSLEDLLPGVDCVVVVGGRSSNNTRELVELCASRNVKAYHVVDASELRHEWFDGVETVGLTAGTSTLDETVEAVRARLEEWEPAPARPWGSAAWCRFFERNARDLPDLPWAEGSSLTETQREAIGRSLQEFQLGESSEGHQFRKSAKRFAQAVGDPEYAHAVDLFIAEEGHHSRLLGRFLDLAGLPRLEKSWTDGVFRRLRKGMPLEVVLSVLLTAEMIAMAYYRAVHDATESRLLIRLCARLLRDERMHLRFHCERLASIRRCRPRWRLALTQFAQRSLLSLTCVVVWWRHAKAFRAGGFAFRRLWAVTSGEFARLKTETRKQRRRLTR